MLQGQHREIVEVCVSDTVDSCFFLEQFTLFKIKFTTDLNPLLCHSDYYYELSTYYTVAVKQLGSLKGT